MMNNQEYQNPNEDENVLEKYGRNLVELAKNGKIDPVIGRDEEIRNVIRILSRKTKNNPVLIGEPGVGKTAIAEGLAKRILQGDVPESLKNKTIFSLDLSLIPGNGALKRRPGSTLFFYSGHPDGSGCPFDELSMISGRNPGGTGDSPRYSIRPRLRGRIRSFPRPGPRIRARPLPDGPG